MIKVLYVYQNYRRSYSSASLSILRGLKKISEIHVDSFEIKPVSYNNTVNRVVNRLSVLQKNNFTKQNRLLQDLVNRGNYNFLFVMKGTDIKSEMLKTIKIANPELKLICFNPDDPFNAASSNNDIVSAIPLYDYYCIWTKKLNKQLLEAGANEIIYMPFGVDDEIIYPVDTEFQYDISFVGNGDTERHQLIRALNEEMLKRGLRNKIHVFGSNWPNIGDQVMVHGQRNGIELLKTIAGSKINLNLLRKQNKNSINMRTFEIPAVNGFMLHEESEEAKNFFKENEEVVYFKTISDLVDKCEFFLKNTIARERLINNCKEKISDGRYSYYNFLQSNLDFIMKNQNGSC